MKDQIRYASFTPQQGKAELSALVACYQDVFADEPWNEWKKCAVCGKKWGNSHKADLMKIDFCHCGQSVDEFWPAEVVREDIMHEVTEKTSCWLAWKQDLVVGFCWGYPITPDALEEKLKLSGFASSVTREFGHDCRIGYQDEIGVRGEYRGHGIAKKMFSYRLEDFRRMGLNVGVVRTKTNPPSVTNLWFMDLGYRVICEYNDLDGRVILARSLESL
jgi:GNAT superfamily N-acetyltransferase